MNIQHLIGFTYAIGQEVTFYCNGKGALRGTIIEQSNYLNKENKEVTGYTIKSVGEKYFHIPENHVFPKSIDTNGVLKIVQYRSVYNEHARIVEKEKVLKKKLEELWVEVQKVTEDI